MYWIPVCIIIMATGIIQWHGVLFWTEMAGPTGWAWSVVLEAAALWLWWHEKGIVRAVGLIGTVVLLSGPMYQISHPAIEAWRAGHVDTVEISMLKRQIEEGTMQLQQFLKNSEARAGWLPAIESVRGEIRAARQRLVELEGRTGKAVDYQAMAIVVIELMALLVITIAQITALRWAARGGYVLRRERPTPENEATGNSCAGTAIVENEGNDGIREPEPEPDIVNNGKAAVHVSFSRKPEKPRLTVLAGDKDKARAELVEWLRKQVEMYDTRAACAEALGIDRREIGYVLRPGGRKPKAETWEKLRECMNKETPFDRASAI